MMHVNKYKIVKKSGDINLNISTNQDFALAGQEDIIKRDFVDTEVENSINEILDYEKVKLLPKNINNNNLTNNITYTLNFLSENGTYAGINNKWSEIGSTCEDLKFRKTSFVKSFLRLDFFDSDILSSQRLLFFITLFPKIYSTDLNDDGSVKQPNQKSLQFLLGNTILDKTLEGEGFSLYDFKDEILPTVGKNIYMVATFNNAKTGESTKFMSSNNLNLSVDNLIKTSEGTNIKNNLHTKYLLKREVNGFYYNISNTYSNNVTNSNNNYNINLYEINAI